MELKIEVIAYIENDVNEQMDVNWGNITSRIRLLEDYVGGLSGLKVFSCNDFNIFAWSEIYTRKTSRETSKKPAWYAPGCIFSQRAKDRPNPLV